MFHRYVWKALTSATVVGLVFICPVLGQSQTSNTVDASPGFVRFQLLLGTSEEQSVTIFSDETASLAIARVESPVEWMKVSFRKAADNERIVRGRSEQPQYRVNVTIDGQKAKVGPISERIRIVTNSSTRPEIMLPVSGVVRAAYRVDPVKIDFGDVRFHDTAATRTISIRSNDLKRPADFVVTRAESTIEGVLGLDLKPTDRPGEFYVTLQIKRTAPPGRFDGIVRLHTNSKFPATFEVPVKGQVLVQ